MYLLTISCRQKRRFDGGYGGRFGVAHSVGSKLMGKHPVLFSLMASCNGLILPEAMIGRDMTTNSDIG